MTSSHDTAVTDLRALLQLATQATAGVTDIVEAMHQTVWNTLGFAAAEPGRARGVTGLAYRGVRAVNRGIGALGDRLLGGVQALAPATGRAESRRRLALLAVLNGVIGDHLAADGNPLAIPLTIRHRGQPLDPERIDALPDPGGRLLLMIHGLCMNDLQWQARRDGAAFDHGQALAEAHGYTPLYLRYNSGLHISHNGRALADALERLLAAWPVPIERLTIVGHSMGGLVARSAVHQAQADNAAWLAHLRDIVFLGTPHHGAPLERAGNWLDTLLASTPYSAPIARLGQLRSAGITDLRYGHLLDSDWQGHGRFRRSGDTRRALPLPAAVRCHAVAAVIASRRGALADRLTGDGLVPLHSALGQHEQAERTLAFAERSQRVVHGINHLALLRDAEVGEQLLAWLAPRRRRPRAG
jgi:pimeloyl-ACP methyl ester carboxylesterase